jgi:hypothetical protein
MFIPITITENIMVPATTNSRAGSAKVVVTEVSVELRVQNCVNRFDCVWVVVTLLVE